MYSKQYWKFVLNQGKIQQINNLFKQVVYFRQQSYSLSDPLERTDTGLLESTTIIGINQKSG